MRKAVRSILEKIAPKTTATIQAIRGRRHIASLQRAWKRTELARQFVTAHGDTVLGGPFRGLKLPYEDCFAGYIPMLVGSLEMELEPAIRRALTSNYSTVINVGCAEGYYAVGFAMKSPSTQVIAHDIDPWARSYCRRLAELNDVANRVAVKSWCDCNTLQQEIRGRTLVLSDCEGYELVLLDEKKCPALRACDIIVECHDFCCESGVTKTISDRFGATHQISTIEIEPRHPEIYPALAVLPLETRRSAIEEARNPNSRWLLLTARNA